MSDGSKGYNFIWMTEYLCSWSLELLKSSRSSRSLDYRHLVFRFSQHFSDRTGRCSPDSTNSCQGDQPSSCGRFTRADTKSQSAHASHCSGQCPSVTWNRASYIKANSPRAVCVGSANDCLLYRTSSANTLAISHVWAHGQGGRPEDGINTCLYQRYKSLALRFGCDSYWIDSACIPEDNQLRKEAIAGINVIFTTSQVVLISDADLQSVDPLAGNVKCMETILSILLVCDWNIRAWTMLEATRANRSIQLLCKDDQTVALLDLLRDVWNNGRVDLAVLLGGVEHLLPSNNPPSRKGLEEAGYSLSQRHASRVGDDVVIWGLMNGRSGQDDALSLWQAQTVVRTAFLVSSAPRIKGILGFGWAPCSPRITPQKRICWAQNQGYIVRYPSYDGGGSALGYITANGLRALWMIQDVGKDTIVEARERFLELYDAQSLGEDFLHDPDTTIDEAEGYTRPDMAIACDVEDLIRNGLLVRSLRPATEDGLASYDGSERRGQSSDLTIVICYKTEEKELWIWEGVYRWGVGTPFEIWRPEEMLIS